VNGVGKSRYSLRVSDFDQQQQQNRYVEKIDQINEFSGHIRH
jgi:hypothetical protein